MTKKRTFWLMLFIVVLGLVLRILFINKPDGLWNDEYVSWYIASIPYGKTFWNAVFAQCHMPFYYFYLKFFIHFFGSDDTMLRCTSVLPGVLSIVSMYFVGKEFKDEKLGILCAAVTSISSFLIYFSQEVRFYALLFLFSSLVLLFTLKLLKEQKLVNIIFFIIFNLLVIFTHTLGFVFVFLNLVFLSIFYPSLEKCEDNSRVVLLSHQKKIIAIWSIILIFSLIGLPLLFSILTTHNQSQFWGHFTVSRLGFLFTDYFSPILTNIVSSPDKFFYNVSFGFFVFGLIPTGIAVTGIINAVKSKKLALLPFCLLAICVAYISILVIASLNGKMVFVSKYLIEIYPILILLMGYGLLEFKKKIRQILIFLFCFLNMFYMFISPVGAPKIRRNEGHKIVAKLLKNADLKNGDFILLNYYPKQRFEKYFNFSRYNVDSINKANYQEYSNEKFDKQFKQNVLGKLKSNQKLTIVILDDVAMYSPVQLQVLKDNPKEYKKVPKMFLAFSDIKNNEMQQGLKHLNILRIERLGSWSVITFLKK